MKYLKIWTSFKDCLSSLSSEEIGRLFLMMLDYAEGGDAPEPPAGNERYVWPTAKIFIDQTAEANERLRQNGVHGGRHHPVRTAEAERPEACESKPNQSEPNSTKPNQTEPNLTKPNQSEPNSTKPNQSEPNPSYKEKKSNEKECKVKKEGEAPGFTPPTVEQVRAFCRERGSPVDPERFTAFYASKGWRVGREPMVDWKAALITWEKRDDDRGPPGARRVTARDYRQRDYTEEELAALSEDPVLKALEAASAQPDH